MRRILIIEDQPDDAAALMRLLRLEGERQGVMIICRWASSLALGLAHVESEEFDCVITDLTLSDASEHVTLAAIPAIQQRAAVVVFSGTESDETIKTVRESGAAFVSKPGGDLLLEKVWSQMNFRRADADSTAGQRAAQERIYEAAPIKETTLVELSLSRVMVIAFTLVTCTAGITYSVLNKMSVMDANVSRIGATLTEMVKSQSEDRAAAQERLAEWTKWRGDVTRDIRELGAKTQTRVETSR